MTITHIPEPGTRWRHYKGGFYMVLTVGRLEASEELMVVYQRHGAMGLDDIWVRPLAEWEADVGDGPRFRSATVKVG